MRDSNLSTLAIRVLCLSILNVVVFTIVAGFMVRSPQATSVPSILGSSLSLFTIDVVLATIHIVLSFMVVPVTSIAVLNRLIFIVYLVSMGYREIDFPMVFREVTAFLVSLIIVFALKRTLTEPLELRAPLGTISRDKYRVNDFASNTIILLLSHAAGALVMSTLLTQTGALSLELYVLGTYHVAIPLVLLALVLLVFKEFPSRMYYVAVGIVSGLGLLGLTSLYLILRVKYVEETKISPSVLYRAKRGLYLGEAQATLVHSRALRKHGEKRNTPGGRGETWRWYRVKHPLYVALEELNTPHIVIVGSSGSGKTVLAKHVALELNRLYGYNFIILDQHGEYRDLVTSVKCRVINASKCPLNPLVLENTSPRERALQLAHVVATIFKLGFLQRRMLEEVVMHAYEIQGIHQEDPSTWQNEPPTLRDLVEVCKKLSKDTPDYQRILPYLILLSEHLSGGEWLSVEDLFLESTIIDMSDLPSDFARALFIDTLMYMLISKMYNMKGAKRTLLVIEEARSMLPRALARELLSRLFTESRKFGYSIIVISQEVARIPKTLVDNAGLRIFFVLNDPRSIEEASRIIAGSESREKVQVIAEALRTLPPHTFIVHATGVSTAFIVRSPFLVTSSNES
mgnify:CR=1 FL=1